MKRVIVILLLLAAIGGGAYYFLKVRPGKTAAATAAPAYEFAKFERRSLRNMVSATGTLAARDLVEVSTQVSGTLSEVLADYNDTVTEGQLIAVIDPSVLASQVKIAQAELMRAQAQLQQAKNNLERYKPMHERGFLSAIEFEPYEIAVLTAEASVLSSQANLDRANQNRGYAEIRAPIDGIVIERTVEPGQTVAASMSAPKLFTIANDLSKMEILASVDESDIGEIKVGQAVRFTVAAYLDDDFTGTVEQIRLMPDVVQNVVNYTVVVSAENPRGKLLPGMTATLDFIVAEVENVLAVPSGALSLRPNEEMMAAMQARRAERQAQREREGGGAGGAPAGGREGFSGGGREGGGGFSGGGRSGGSRADFGTLWFFVEGKLQMLPVRKGVSDGAWTEVLPLRDTAIDETLEIITKVNTPAASTTAAAAAGAGGPPSGLRRLGF